MQESRPCVGSSSTVRGPRLRPPWLPPSHTCESPGVCVQRSEWHAHGARKKHRGSGVSVSGQLQKGRKQAASWSADLSGGCGSRGQGCVVSQDEARVAPKEGTCRHPPSVTPVDEGTPASLCPHAPAPGTSGHVWGAAGGAGARLGVSHRVVCPHPPPGRGLSAKSRVPGGCVWGRGPEFGPTRPSFSLCSSPCLGSL